MRSVIIIALTSLALLTSLVVGIGFYYAKQLQQPLGLSSSVLFEIKSGDTQAKVLAKLLAQSETSYPKWVGKIWLKLTFSQKTIKKGVYQLNESDNLTALFTRFIEGKQKQFSIALVEGLRWQQWYAQLDSHEHIYNDWSTDVERKLLQQASQQYGLELSSLEGLLLADTYFFDKHTQLSAIVQRALVAMAQVYQSLNQNYLLPQVLSNEYQALILASIVEKETAVANERPLIAGVFINRLDKNMRLQTDPTVIYGLGDAFDGNITRNHLRQATPYNTYVIKGLPPTPIAMVGRQALEAVYQYADTSYLYFVANGKGAHVFSDTLEQHNQAVQQYQRGGNKP